MEREPRARLTIGPIGRIVSSEVRVARPPNAPASTHFASTSLTVRAPPVSAHYLQGTIQYLKEPPAKSQSDLQKPRASASAEYSARARVSQQPGHQSQHRHPERKTSGYHLQGCHCPGTSEPLDPEAKRQCLRDMNMNQCHHLGSIIHLQG